MHEFDDLIRRLEDNRPEATELELDQIKQRVRRRAARPERRQDMKSRLAILLMLVAGHDAQHRGRRPCGAGSDERRRERRAVRERRRQEPEDVLGEAESGGDAHVQESRQVSAGADGGDELPFTGFLAIPVLIGGVALLSGGLVLRHRTRAPNDD